MKKNEVLQPILDELLERNLGKAVQAMDDFLAVHPHQSNSDRLQVIRTDFQMMADYWRNGFKDPQLSRLYDNLLQRMYVLYADMDIDYTVRHSSFFSSFYMRAHVTARDWSPAVIKESLESFVSDVAMLDLEPSHTSAVRRRELFSRHQELMVGLFDHIMTSGIWTDGQASAMEEILLSPTIDTNDQQLLVSSIMLSAIEHFDMAKFRVLVHVYQQATDVPVKQRALVGWVFSMNAEIGQKLYPEELLLVEQLLEDEHCCKELTELQKQMIYCISAEEDHATIQKEIMPDLMQNPGFTITPTGIVEKDEDPIRDILYSDEEEQRLERLESSFQRMKDMQQQGSDIYFGGFSQMKRFSFFRELCNWFVPFYIDHPDISTSMEKLGKNRFLQGMMQSGPFCNSDKYSFVMAFEQVLNQIPDSMRGMMERGEASVQEMAEEEIHTDAYIRRIYLQDLYRFFRLYPRRGEFTTIFQPDISQLDISQFDISQLDEKPYLFFACPLFTSTRLEPYFNEVTAFLLKKRRMHEASVMTGNYGAYRRDFRFYMMAGYLALDGFDAWEHGAVGRLSAVVCYGHALELKPEHERAWMGYARALFEEERYQEALNAYEHLLESQPNRKDCLLNKAVCLTKLAKYGEAVQLLFRLNYESPGDTNVNRVLAWALACDGRYEQAEKIYGQLLSVEKPLSEDFLNSGYCLWFGGHIDEAADCFHRYMEDTGMDAEAVITSEIGLLRQKGITEPEIQMMLYIL